MITVRLLGALDIRDAGGDELSTLLRQPKRIALLSYLAVAQPRGFHRRDTLMGLFWPESTQEQARNALSQALHVLRQELGEGAIVTRGEGDVALSEDVVSVDVWDLDAASAGGDHERVVDLYRGPLLAGFAAKASAAFDRWLDGAGDRVANVYAESLECLAESASERRDWRKAVEWWGRLVRHHPYNTREVLCLMRALEAAGDRAGALERAARHTELLRNELAAEPPSDVLAYAERLRLGSERDVMEPRATECGASATSEMFDVVPMHQHSEATAAGTLNAATEKTPADIVAGVTARWSNPLVLAGLFGVGAAVILAVTYFLMMQLGLPNWVLVAAAALFVVILPIAMATALVERERIAMAASTPSSMKYGVVGRWLRWRNAAMVTATAFTGLGLVTSGYMGMKTLGTGPLSTVMAKGALEEHDRILVADFENRTSDSLLGATLTDALRIDLRQSPVIRVLESQELRDALRRMGRDVTEPVTPGLAHELAEREGIKAVVEGEVGVLGEGYVLSGRLVGVATGEVLAAERAAARNDQELIRAVDDLSAKLRERIGESLRTVRGTPPLAQVTTSSLEALRLYTQADRAWRENQLDAIPYYEQAIALDTAFGMAYRRLIITLRNLQLDPVREGELARKAYAHRDRLTDRERYLIEADYYGRVEGDLEKVEATLWRMVERYPDDLTALNGLGNLLRSQRRWAEAENMQRRAREVAAGTLGGQWSPAYTSILPCQFALNDSAAIDTSLRVLEAVRPADALRFAAQIAAARRDYDAAWNGFEQLAQQEPERGWNGLQLIATVRGRLGLATELSRLVTAGCRQRNDHYCLVVEASQLARTSAHYRGSTTDAVRLLDSAVHRHLDSVPAIRRRQALWTAAMSYAMLGKDSVAGSILAAYRSENSAEVIRMDFDRFEALGWVALASGQLERAKTAFRAWYEAYTYCTLCGLYELALTFDQAGSLDSALAYYEQALTTPEIDRLSWEWDWLPTTYRRLGELYEQRGEPNNAVYYYSRFVELWKDADPELQPQVYDMMRRIERLMGETPS